MGRLGLTGACLVLALIFIVPGMLYVRPLWHLNYHGTSYGAMATDPFKIGPEAPFPHRILTPLISYVFGLRGRNIMVTNLLAAIAFLVLIVRHFSTRDREPRDALIAGAVFTFSLPTLGTFFNSGYCDSSLYVIMFLMWLARRRRIWFYALFLLGLLNRESMLFMLPWYAFERFRCAEGSVRARLAEQIVGFGAGLILFGAFYGWLMSRQTIELSASYYLEPLMGNLLYWLDQCGHPLLGLFTVFKLLWIVPILAVAHWGRTRRWVEIISIMLLFLCTSSQLVVAYDASRIFTQGFMLMVPALDLMLRENPFQFRKMVGWLLAVNLFIPEWYTAAHTIVTMKSLLGYLS